MVHQKVEPSESYNMGSIHVTIQNCEQLYKGGYVIIKKTMT